MHDVTSRKVCKCVVETIVGDGNYEGITLVANRYLAQLNDDQKANFKHVQEKIFGNAVNPDKNPGPAQGRAEDVVRTLVKRNGEVQLTLDFQLRNAR